MGVDHGRLDVFVAEQLLDGADVVAGHQQVGREAVAEGVAADLLCDACRTSSRIHGLADYRLVEMVASLDPRAWIDASAAGRKNVLPLPVAVGVRVLALEGVRQINAAESFLEVLFVQGPDFDQVVLQPVACGVREHGHPIASPLGIADRDVAEVEVDVLDAKPQTLEDAHAGAVEQQDHELNCALEMREHGRHLVAAEDVRQAPRLAGADHVVEPVDLDLENLTIEEKDRGQRLALGRDRDPSLDREVGKEAVEVVAVEIAWVAAVELDIAADPGGVGFLGADGVVADPDFGSDPIHETPGASRRGSGERFDVSHGGINGA